MKPGRPRRRKGDRPLPGRPNVGWLLLAVILALSFPLIAGLLLDNWLGSSPLLAAAGGVAGSVAGVIVVYRSASRALNAYLPHESDAEKEPARQESETECSRDE